jgi:hypothetical protein
MVLLVALSLRTERGWGNRAFFFCLLILAVPCRSSPEQGQARESASDLVAQYNARRIGNPGARRVTVELIGDGYTRQYRIINVWRSRSTGAEMLSSLESPDGLRGTSYLQIERQGAEPDMLVYLYLPAGQRRVIQVLPSVYREGLLGSEFSYSDLRLRLPVQGYRYSITGQTVLNGYRAWKVMARVDADVQGSSWSHAIYYLAQDYPFMLGADYYTLGPEPFKRMRVETMVMIDGVRTASRMVMRNVDGRSTTIKLLESRFTGFRVKPKFFSPETLPTLDNELASLAAKLHVR